MHSDSFWNALNLSSRTGEIKKVPLFSSCILYLRKEIVRYRAAREEMKERAGVTGSEKGICPANTSSVIPTF
jgi:hypothetical protein